MARNKITTLENAIGFVKDADILLCGGFGMTGNPVHLIHQLALSERKDLTYIGNNIGEPNLAGGRLLKNGQVKKMIGSFFTSNADAVNAAQSGTVEFELIPQGTLAEAIRAGGSGIGGFYTPTAANTELANTDDIKIIDGVTQIYVSAIKGDVAFIRAWQGDKKGNLRYRMTEQNFNPVMATAAKIVIAEVEEIVPVGQLDPNTIHTQGCYVDYIVEDKLELEDLGSSALIETSKEVPKDKEAIAKRALKEITPGSLVNLGIGIPTLVANYIDDTVDIQLHTENGMLGIGPSPESGGALHFPVNAGKIPVTPIKGTSYFDSSTSFAMIRGGHIDVAIMGGLEVDGNGNLANWAIPGKPLLGVGGAMDLAVGAKKLIVTMTHRSRNGRSKIVQETNLPITAEGVVDLIITEMAVFKFVDGKLTLTELMEGYSISEIKKATEAYFDVSPQIENL